MGFSAILRATVGWGLVVLFMSASAGCGGNRGKDADYGDEGQQSQGDDACERRGQLPKCISRLLIKQRYDDVIDRCREWGEEKGPTNSADAGACAAGYPAALAIRGRKSDASKFMRALCSRARDDDGRETIAAAAGSVAAIAIASGEGSKDEKGEQLADVVITFSNACEVNPKAVMQRINDNLTSKR